MQRRAPRCPPGRPARIASVSRAAATAVGAASAISVVRLLLEQQRDDLGDGRRLAGARARRRRPRTGAARRSRPRAPGAGREPLRDPGARARPRRRRRRRRPASAAQVGGDLALLAPVAVEVQRRALEPQRPARARGLAATLGEPLAVSGHGSAGQVDRLVGVDRRGVADRREVDVHVAEARAPGLRAPARAAPPSRSRPPARRGGRATCTSAGASTPTSLNSRRRPVARATIRASVMPPLRIERVAERRRRARPAGATRTRRRRAVDHRRLRPDHPAHEQVLHAAEVRARGRSRPAASAGSGAARRVQQRLQPVVAALHLGGERGGPVVPGGQLLAGRARASSSCSRRP